MTIICGKEVELPDPKDNVAVVTYVRDRLLEQGKKSTGEDGTCKLRGKDNTACAVGHLLPDWMFHKIREAIAGATVFLMDNGYSGQLLNRIQKIHDVELYVSWKAEFDKLIKEYSK